MPGSTLCGAPFDDCGVVAAKVALEVQRRDQDAVRDALPNASFIGFTGTPIELTDKTTRAVFDDYMKEFEEYLEEEGVGEDERREIIFLPTIKLPAFARDEIQLNVIRPKADMPDFKKSIRLTLTASKDGSTTRL
jgi:hypothetical protein